MHTTHALNVVDLEAVVGIERPSESGIRRVRDTRPVHIGATITRLLNDYQDTIPPRDVIFNQHTLQHQDTIPSRDVIFKQHTLQHQDTIPSRDVIFKHC